jgi:hypothetical protein
MLELSPVSDPAVIAAERAGVYVSELRRGEHDLVGGTTAVSSATTMGRDGARPSRLRFIYGWADSAGDVKAHRAAERSIHQLHLIGGTTAVSSRHLGGGRDGARPSRFLRISESSVRRLQESRRVFRCAGCVGFARKAHGDLDSSERAICGALFRVRHSREDRGREF